MFRRNHRDEVLALRVDHLMTSVVLPDDQDRLDALAAHVAPDVVYVSPSGGVRRPGGAQRGL